MLPNNRLKYGLFHLQLAEELSYYLKTGALCLLCVQVEEIEDRARSLEWQYYIIRIRLDLIHI